MLGLNPNTEQPRSANNPTTTRDREIRTPRDALEAVRENIHSQFTASQQIFDSVSELAKLAKQVVAVGDDLRKDDIKSKELQMAIMRELKLLLSAGDDLSDQANTAGKALPKLIKSIE